MYPCACPLLSHVRAKLEPQYHVKSLSSLQAQQLPELHSSQQRQQDEVKHDYPDATAFAANCLDFGGASPNFGTSPLQLQSQSPDAATHLQHQHGGRQQWQTTAVALPPDELRAAHTLSQAASGSASQRIIRGAQRRYAPPPPPPNTHTHIRTFSPPQSLPL